MLHIIFHSYDIMRKAKLEALIKKISDCQKLGVGEGIDYRGVSMREMLG